MSPQFMRLPKAIPHRGFAASVAVFLCCGLIIAVIAYYVNRFCSIFYKAGAP